MNNIKIKRAAESTIKDFPNMYTLYGNKMRGKKLYNANVCAFDIETTVLDEINQSIMYIWQFAIDDIVFYGRTWEEFKKFLSMLKAVSYGRQVIVFVHNLSYEIQFLSGIFHFDNQDIFPTEPRHVLRANIDNIEFRCSYRLTNLSLKAFTERYNVEHKKLDDFVYEEKRYPWTELSERELEYCVNDVLGLVEGIKALMKLHNDDLYTLPLTSTGFVRRECKALMHGKRPYIKSIFPTQEVFTLLRREFRGGNTHANRYYTDEVLTGQIYSKDISSSYPSQQCSKLYPITPFEEIKSVSCNLIDRYIELGKAVLFTVSLFDVQLRDKYISVPYIATAKCTYYKGVVADNGRVLYADEIEITCNEIDWKIIVSQYTFDAEITTGYRASKGSLPQEIIDLNIRYFKSKTELKGVQGQELYYMKDKELLNSIYGMTVQNPAKTSLLFNDCLYEEDTSKSEEELLIAAQKKAFIVYQWGCWTTAHARDSLQAGIDICGDDLIYVDTDSCKYRGIHDFSLYNADRVQDALKSGLYATDRKGIIHYGGVFEDDGTYDSFITQGAKKYAYIDNSGLHVTVSGVGKRKGAESLQAAGGLDAFRDGFIFHNCGKTRSIFNDGNYGKFEVDGHILEVTRNVVIEEQDYTLNKTDQYRDIIEESKESLRKIIKSLEFM